MTDDKLRQAIQLHRAGRLGAARAVYEQLVDTGPADARIVSLLGQLQMQMGDTHTGIDNLHRAAESAPQDMRIGLTLVRGLASAGRIEEASTRVTQLLEHDDANAEAWATLAAVHRHVGEHRHELMALQRAVSYAEHDIPILIALANAQAANADTPGAVETLSRAATLAPDNIRIQNNLGALNLRLNRLGPAVAALQSALRIDPDYATANANLAIALHASGRLTAAREVAEHAVGLAPNNPEPRAELASILMTLGDLAGAEAIFNDALRTTPDNQRVLAGLAELRERQGRTDAGLALLATTINTGKATPDTRLAAASLARRARRREMALEFLRPLQDDNADPRGTLDAGQRRRLCFLLGDIYDGSADFGNALRYYDEANRCAAVDFDSDTFDRYVDTIIDNYSDKPQPAPHRDPRRLFIVGMPRSGTSLVETMLARHPDVHACGELALVGQLLGSSGYPDTRLTDDDYQALANHYCGATAAPPGTMWMTDKMPLNFLYLGALAQMMPDAIVLHCQRDPRDSLLSCYFQNFVDPALAFSFRFDHLSQYWHSYHRLMHHWKTLLPDMIATVQYEDLVRDPGFVMQPLLERLGLTWDDAVLSPERSDRYVSTASHAQVREPIHQRSVGRFARYRPFLGERAQFFDALT